MTNLISGTAVQETAKTLYAEIQHKWNGEISYFAETVPAEITLDDWHSGIWTNGGFDSNLYTLKVCKVIR